MKLFINEDYVKRFNSLDKSIDDANFTYGIEKAQGKYILKYLGTALYNKLEADIPSSIAGDYKTLLEEYVAPCLAFFAYYESFDKLNYKVENNGVFKRNTDTAQPIDFKEMNFKMGRIMDDAEFAASKLTAYLCANTSKFTEYINPGNQQDTVYPERKTFRSQLFTSKRSFNPEGSYSKKYNE